MNSLNFFFFCSLKYFQAVSGIHVSALPSYETIVAYLERKRQRRDEEGVGDGKEREWMH